MSLHIIDLSAPATLAAAAVGIRQALAGERVAFVLPVAADAFASEVRLKVLRRQADAAGVQVGLVTTDADVRYFAQRAGLPTFASISAASGSWRYPKVTAALPVPEAARPAVVPPPQKVGRGLTAPTIVTTGGATVFDGVVRRRKDAWWARSLGYIAFSLLVAGLLFGLAVVLLPRATVTLVPAHTQFVSSIEVTAQTGIDEPDASTGLIPARIVQARVVGTGSAEATGSDFAPAGKASGFVTLINRTAREVRVPVNTVVRTVTGNNIRFRTQAEVTVPAGIGQRASVAIESVEAGREGNVAASTISEVEGPLGLSLRASNASPTGGGTVADVVVVTQADKERVLGQLQESVQRQAYEELAGSLRQGEYIPPETVQTFTLAETYDRFAGEQADSVGLTLQLLARGMAVDLEGARSLADRTLRESVPANHFLLDDTVQIGQPSFTRFGEDAVSMTLTASGDALVPIPSGQVRALLAGVPLAEADSVLQRRLNLARPPVITVERDWLGRLPYIPTRIQVRVLQE